MIFKTIVAQKIADNDIRVYDPLFRQPGRIMNLMPLINWLCSMNILNDIPEDNQAHDLADYLKSIRHKYINDSFALKQIDRVINF